MSKAERAAAIPVLVMVGVATVAAVIAVAAVLLM